MRAGSASRRTGTPPFRMLKSADSGSVFSNVTPVAPGGSRSNSGGAADGAGTHVAGTQAVSSAAVASSRMYGRRRMR